MSMGFSMKSTIPAIAGVPPIDGNPKQALSIPWPDLEEACIGEWMSGQRLGFWAPKEDVKIEI